MTPVPASSMTPGTPLFLFAVGILTARRLLSFSRPEIPGRLLLFIIGAAGLFLAFSSPWLAPGT